MAITETYTSEQELRNLYKGLKEDQLINMLINQHHTIRELSKNITVTHCCKSDSEQLSCKCGLPKRKQGIGFSCMRTDCDANTTT